MVSLERGRERDVEAKVRYIWFTARKVEKAETKEKGERERREVCVAEKMVWYIRKVSICNFLCSGLNTVII